MSPLPPLLTSPAATPTPSITRRRHAQARACNDAASVPTWLRTITIVCAATSRAIAVHGAPALAPAMGATPIGQLSPPAPGTPSFVFPQVSCSMPMPDPSIADFLADTADASACHWGLDGTSLWGDDDIVLTGGGEVKAYEVRALVPEEQSRTAALASILGQAPSRLRAFAGNLDDRTSFTLKLPHFGAGVDPSLTLIVRNTVALYANGTRAAYAGTRGLFAPLARKLALQLRACVSNVGFETSAEVFDAVLGNSQVQQVSYAATLEAALRRTSRRPILGTLAQTGRTQYLSLWGKTNVELYDNSTRVWNNTGTLDYTVSRGTVGLLGAQLEHAPFAVEVYNPRGKGGPTDPPPDSFWANATTLVQRLPLTGIGNCIDGTLTLAT